MPDSTLRAALLDSGGVLMRPIGGRWNPRADFEKTVQAHAPWLDPAQFPAAIAEGDRFMGTVESTPDYKEYHRVILSALGVEAGDDLLAALVRPVEAGEILETFPEVPDTLRRLRERGVRLAVVSDAWPDLPEHHEGLGIHEFFDAYAISGVLGFRKPDPRIYRHASDALGLAPGECVFVDDDPALVAAAVELGYTGRVMARGPRPDPDPDPDLPCITSLDALLDLF